MTSRKEHFAEIGQHCNCESRYLVKNTYVCIIHKAGRQVTHQEGSGSCPEYLVWRFNKTGTEEFSLDKKNYNPQGVGKYWLRYRRCLLTQMKGLNL